MTLGKTIKQLRKETFLSQEQLAAKLDITAQAVSKWENEESYPDILFLPKIAAIFGVKIDELFDYNEESAYQQIENMLDHERYFTHADFSKSENFLLQQLSINPNDLHALTLLGDLYHTYAIKLDEKAACYTKQALALNPDDKSLHNTFHNAMHGGRLDWNVANHSELIAYYQNFIQEHPTITRASRKEYDIYLEKNQEWQAYFLVAGRYASRGEYEKAIALFEKSFDLQPKPRYIDHLESIAQLYLRMYKKNEAKHAYKRELQLLKEEWQQDDSADVQRVKALLAKCNG